MLTDTSLNGTYVALGGSDYFRVKLPFTLESAGKIIFGYPPAHPHQIAAAFEVVSGDSARQAAGGKSCSHQAAPIKDFRPLILPDPLLKRLSALPLQGILPVVGRQLPVHLVKRLMHPRRLGEERLRQHGEEFSRMFRSVGVDQRRIVF